jgi:hypothetical protein
VNTKLPAFGMMIASRRFRELDDLFARVAWRTVGVMACGGVGLWLTVGALRAAGHPLGDRFLDPLPLAILVVTSIINQVVFAQAAYLRAHKEEPFLIPSVVHAVLIGPSTYLLGQAFGATGMLTAYLAVCTVFGLGWGSLIFRQKRLLWHRATGA